MTPFYCGQEAQVAAARWFAELWQRFGYGTGVHIRRVHYQIVSQQPPVAKPNGTVYENTETDWGFLVSASKAARYLKMVAPDAFVDRRNPDPHIFSNDWGTSEPGMYLDGEYRGLDVEIPQFPHLPRLRAIGYDEGPLQRYHMECWCEKSTVNDILEPVCRDHNANLVTGAGELSITAALAFVKRAQQAAKPCRIFYISDFDPAGLGMPISIARKIEYFLAERELDLDVRLEPLALTQGQCREYRLPRTPIKETERRRGKFEANFGEGATELDALEALYPGTLRRMVEGAIHRYYDANIEAEAREERARLQNELNERCTEALEDLEPEIQDLRAEFAVATSDYEATLAGFKERLQRLHEGVVERLRDIDVDLTEFACPQAVEVDESDDNPLYDSGRNYLTQLARYQAQRAGGNTEED